MPLVRAHRFWLLLLAIGCKRTPEIEEPSRPRGPEPTTAALTAAPQPPAATGNCVLSIPNNQAELALFPTEEGLREFTQSASGGDQFQMATVMQKHHAVLIPSQSPCERLQTSKDGTQVRVTGGAQTNQVGWVATDWTRGN